MRRTAIVQQMVADLEADAALVAVLGGERIHPRSAGRAYAAPSIEWYAYGESEREMLNPFFVRIDLFARGQASADTIEDRIRRVLGRDARRAYAGVDCETSYQGTAELEPPEPGVVHRALDFRFVPVRER